MAQIISIVNQKGGVGKTTTALNLSAALARMGKLTLLVDLDPQANATSGLGLRLEEQKPSIYETLIGLESIQKIILNTNRENLFLIPSKADLAGANIELVNFPNRELKLRETLLEIRHNFDFIFIDCPPSLGLLTLNGLTAADALIIPVQAEYYSLEGLGQLLTTIEMIKKNLRADLEILGSVITMFDARNRLSSEVMQELYKFFPGKIFRTVIPRTVKLAEAPSFGQTIFEYEASGKGANAFERLAKEFLESIEYLGFKF